MEHRTFTWIWAAGVGAGAMFMLDPDRGRRRRAMVVNRVVHTTHKLADAAAATGRELGHRAAGAAARVRGVCGVDNRLGVHDTAGDVPGLQGGESRQLRAVDGRSAWLPTAKLLSSAGTLALVTWGALARRRGDHERRSPVLLESLYGEGGPVP